MAATGSDGQAGPGQRFSSPTDGIGVMPAPALDGLFVQGGTLTVAVVYQDDPVADPTIYIDGVPQRLDAQGMTNGTPEPDAPVLHLGGVPLAPDQTFDGILDEVRVAAVPRSPAWITVEVASLRDELASYGPPRTSPCE